MVIYLPTDLKKGVDVQIDQVPYRVVEYNQKVVGRGGSIVNIKLKNLIDQSVLAKTVKGQEKIESANITTKVVQYLYCDSQNYHFMDLETFDQSSIGREIVASAGDFIKEGENVTLLLFNDNVINIELPKNVFLEVTYTENITKGDTTSSVLKDATLETGLVIRVPAFIKIGDIVSVDTATSEYRERKKD